jgi:FRG domain
MHETHGASWSEFEAWLGFVDAERTRLGTLTGLHVSAPLYRGHANAKWKLETTLERHYPTCKAAVDYYSRAFYARDQIEAHTGRNWAPMSILDYEKFVEASRLRTPPDSATLEYLAYLRHHSFPSPLLDWSKSPYVAAYFAMGSAAAQTDRVAIYAFVEHAGYGKGTSSASPAIHSIGSYIRAHRRHFLQQSEYTYCVVRQGEEWHYASHDSAIELGHGEPQDLLWSFTLPVSERSAALKHLDKFNLNAFSLLGSEESLMETVAFRVLGEQ